jgi:hypothetical protein
MMRRRASGRSQELVLTAVAVTFVGIAWALITLRIVISWILSEVLDHRHQRELRQLEAQREQQRLLELHRRKRSGHVEQRATHILERTAAAADELVPAVEAVAAAWHRGKQAARQPDTGGRSRELVGDADREGVIEELQGHMVAGRLTVEELEERVEVAHVARTRGELDRAREHLPRVRS